MKVYVELELEVDRKEVVCIFEKLNELAKEQATRFTFNMEEEEKEKKIGFDTERRRVFIAEHDAHYVGPGLTVVVAENEEKAREQVVEEIPKHGLDPSEGIKIREVYLNYPSTETVWDGDY